MKGLKTCRSFEVPFANANGAVVTPEKCRLFGHGLAKALRELMLESEKGGASAAKCCGVDRDFLVKLLSIKSVTSDIAKVNEAVDFVKEHFGVEMERNDVVCIHSSQNNQCIGSRCPFSKAQAPLDSKT